MSIKGMLCAASAVLLSVCGLGEIVDVYDLSLKIQMPVVKSGVREFKAVKCDGTVVVTWADSEDTNPTATVTLNNKTQGFAYDVEEAAFSAVVFGKQGKSYSVSLSVISDMLEFVANGKGKSKTKSSTVALANKKSIKSTSCGTCGLCGECSETPSCGYCGEEVVVEDPCGTCRTTSICQKLWSAKGNLTGTADCLCGENSPTYEASACGASSERQSKAPCYGTWSMKYSKTKSTR